MTTIAEAVAREIEERRGRCTDRPDRELIEHLLVAVQRERVAAVGYDTVKLGERLARAPLPDDARRMIHRAITQVWLDETLHARYVLGVLLRQRALLVQLGARSEDLEGGVGGWMTAVVQHTTWREAPAERLTAALLEAGGKLTGKIPAEVREALAHKPLRDWCAFSADAEDSAVLSFDRMIELAHEVSADPARFPDCELPRGFADELARMLRDERAHKAVFERISALLGADDGLRPGSSADDVRDAIASVEGWFDVAGAGGAGGARASRAASHPVCRGGVVVVARGDQVGDKLQTFERALEQSGLYDVLAARVAACATEPSLLEVVIKIDLMLAYHSEDRSSYVDPVLVERLVDLLWERGYRRLVVCDAQNVYGRYYANRSIEQVARYVGLTPVRYRLVDLATEQEPHAFAHVMGVYTIAATWRDAGARISFAKLKTHPVAIGQLALRNTGTVVPQDGEYFLADRLSDFSQVAAAVLHDFPPDFGIIDGYENAADGLMGAIADPTPKHPHVIVAGADVAAVDCVALGMMGERDSARAPDVRAAIDLLGDPRPHTHVVGDTTPLADWDRADAGLLARPLAALASPVYASLSRQGALFTAALDEKAFPPLGETLVLGAARRALRVLLGIDR
jgi:uncharacterized protein (DUF362 family)